MMPMHCTLEVVPKGREQEQKGLCTMQSTRLLPSRSLQGTAVRSNKVPGL